MGGLLSMAVGVAKINDHGNVSSGGNCKRQRTLPIYFQYSRLIPGLPDEISMQIFARLPRICYFSMRLVAPNWKAAVMSPELFKLRKELGMTEEWLYLLMGSLDDKFCWHALDPLSKKWQRLPPMPSVSYKEENWKGLTGSIIWNLMGSSTSIADIIKGWFWQKNASEELPLSGCSVGVLDGCLYVIGGFSGTSAMKCVWKYDPVTNEWTEMSPMSIGRAYCKTSILGNKLYVVGGVSRDRGGLTPLQSAEVFDPSTDAWHDLPSMPCSYSQTPTSFLVDMLKPIATGMTSYRGKLYVPQSLYSWPFFVDIGGETYDPKTNSWNEMPVGMGEGWPAKQAGTKLSIVIDGELYAFDPSNSLNNGTIKVYDVEKDAWDVVIEQVPICDLKQSETPYLLAGFHGKLHFITKDASHEIAVLQADVEAGVDNLTPKSSSSLASSSVSHPLEPTAKSDAVIWKLVAAKNFGSSELVNCQVINI